MNGVHLGCGAKRQRKLCGNRFCIDVGISGAKKAPVTERYGSESANITGDVNVCGTTSEGKWTKNSVLGATAGQCCADNSRCPEQHG